MKSDCKSMAPICDANCSASMLASDVGVSQYVTATTSSVPEVGWGSLSTSEFSTSDSVCTRMERLMQRKSEYTSAVEFEIEASKVHWSEVDESSDEDGEEKETDLQVYQRLKQKWGNFFHDYGDSLVLREKIAEGGQAEIFNAEYAYPDSPYKEMTVVKVFKHGWALRDLEKQWPVGMLDNQRQGGWFWDVNACVIWGATLLDNGRFAFRMMKHWGDLRQLIDLRMRHHHNQLPLWKRIVQNNGNHGPPFTRSEVGQVLLSIAQGMLELHEMNIIHKDLKASNVLVDTLHLDENTYDNFDAVHDKFECKVADFECSARVVGTGYWRAPEILQALQNSSQVNPHLFTKEVDVYSYAMTCYEVVTGHFPFKDLKVHVDCYQSVVEGRRPELPEYVDVELKELLRRCWQKNPSERPPFGEIVECIKEIYGIQSSDDEAFDDEDEAFYDEASVDEASS